MIIYHCVIAEERRTGNPVTDTIVGMASDRTPAIAITTNTAPQDEEPMLVTQLHTMTNTLPNLNDPQFLYVSSTEDGSVVTVLKNEIGKLNMVYAGWAE